MSYLADELGFKKVYTSPRQPQGNSVLERSHSFLKHAIARMKHSYEHDWDTLTHIATTAFNIFPSRPLKESPFFLMFGRYFYYPTLHKLLRPKLRYMGDDTGKIQLDLNLTV